MVPSTQPHERGFQRDWIWRGWRIRYTYLPAGTPTAGVPLLLIHGFGASREQWRSNLSVLSQNHPVYALDLLGFGASQKAATRYSIDLWATQVYEFWQAYFKSPVILIGHSLGALVTLAAIVHHPEMAKGAVFITLPAARQNTVPQWLEPFAAILESIFAGPPVLRPLLRIVRQRPVIRAALKKIYMNQDWVTDDLVSSFIHPAYDQGVSRSFCYLAQSATKTGYSPSLKELLKQLNRPSLLLWGEKDRIVPYQQSKVLTSLNSHLKLVSIPSAGHCLYDEAAITVNPTILNWIQSIGG